MEVSELIAFTNDDHYKVICQIAPNLDSVYVGMLVARSGRTLTITGASPPWVDAVEKVSFSIGTGAWNDLIERELRNAALLPGDLRLISASHKPKTQVSGRDA